MAGAPLFMTKLSSSLQQLRNQIRAERRQLSTGVRLHRARRMNRLLWRQRELRDCRNVAAYLSCNGEMDTELLINILWQRRLNCYLPKLNGSGRSMLFAPYQRHSPMRRNRFGIREPMVERRLLRSGRHLDLVLMPLVAFDKHGNRLGMGGGFYDRTFAWRKQRRRRPVLVGLAYDFQGQGWLPSHQWDVPLDMVVTESRVLRFRRA